MYDDINTSIINSKFIYNIISEIKDNYFKLIFLIQIYFKYILNSYITLFREYFQHMFYRTNYVLSTRAFIQ